MSADVLPVAVDLAAATPPPVAVDSHYANRPGRQWRLVTILALLTTLALVDRQIISLLVNGIEATFKISDTQFSFLIGIAFALANVGLTLPAGYLADRFNRKYIFLLGALLWSGMTMLGGASTSFLQLFLARAGIGGAEAVITPTSMSMMRSALSPARFGRGFAVVTLGGLVGAGVALILGGAVIRLVERAQIHALPLVGAVQPWQAVLIFVGLLGLPVALLTLLVREPARTTKTAAASSYGEALRFMLEHWRIYLPLVLAALSLSMLALSYGAWLAVIPQRSYGLTPAQVGAPLGLILMGGSLFGYWVHGALVDWFDRRHGVVSTGAIGIIGYSIYIVFGIATPLAPTLGVFWALATIQFMLTGSATVTQTLMARATPERLIGRVAAIQALFAGLLASAVGPSVIAIIADHVFHGPRALADGLAVGAVIYGAVTWLSFLAIYRAVRKNPALFGK